ncbi:MAG: ATP-binding protein [Clostridium sp.]|uniref:ATP-binding protein n=1 Tax=Clostridium sp. TaxID=1506 RepID=UPI0039E9E3B4
MRDTKDCAFRDTCKKYGTADCNNRCYPHVFLYGIEGTGGFWRTRNVPKKYENSFLKNLPIKEDNPAIYKAVEIYIADIINRVQKQGKSLYFVGGTGTGKTTTAVTILNEYLRARCKQHLTSEKAIEYNPVFFMRLAELQNVYNSQFRGTPELQAENALKYSTFKEMIKKVELLVVDDLALRSCPEGFQNELYELIDHRAIEELATLITSNVPYENLFEYLDDRIISRIQGMCRKPAVFKGNDHRQDDLF